MLVGPMVKEKGFLCAPRTPLDPAGPANRIPGEPHRSDGGIGVSWVSAGRYSNVPRWAHARAIIERPLSVGEALHLPKPCRNERCHRVGTVAFSVKNSCWMSRIWRWGPDPGTCRPGPGGRLLPGEGRPAEVGPLALRREGIVSTNNTCAAFGGGGCGGRGERGRIPFLARPHSISTFVFREVYCTQYQLAAV